MKTNFKTSLKHVLVHEGGWADNPKDPGGATMKGVTLAVYRRFFGAEKSKADLHQISDEELEQIYRTGYWDKCRCDELPGGIDYTVFDAAVNSGPNRSAKWLQAAIGATQDGSIGPNTLAKVDGQAPVALINDMCDRRLSFLRGLSTWPTFGTGWGRRVEGVRTTAIAMAGETGAEVTGAEEADNPPAVDFDIVRKGSKGEWVRKLQTILGIQVDGIFGSGTEAALKSWQEKHGLEADGIAGRNTYRTMGLIA